MNKVIKSKDGTRFIRRGGKSKSPPKWFIARSKREEKLYGAGICDYCGKKVKRVFSITGTRHQACLSCGKKIESGKMCYKCVK